MMRRILGSLADGFLKVQNTLFPITAWMPRFYRVKTLINWQANHTLDASCGTGELTVWMAKQGLKVSGTNISQHEIDVSQSVAKQAHLDIDFRVGDLSTQTPFEAGSFDQIISLDTVVHIPDDNAVFREFHRLLAPGGRLLVSLASIAPSGKGYLFAGEKLIPKLVPKFLYTDPIWEGKSWLALTSQEQKERFFQHRFYNAEDLTSQVSNLFTTSHFEYALHLFTVWATDLIFGVRFFRFLEPTLFTLAARLDRLFYKPHRRGYLLFAVLIKK